MALRTLTSISDFSNSGINYAFSNPTGAPAYVGLQDTTGAKHMTWYQPTGPGEAVCGVSSMITALAVNSVTVTWQWFASGGGVDAADGRAFLRKGGVNYYGGVLLLGGGGTVTALFLVDPSTGLPWTTVSINAIQGIGCEVANFYNAVAVSVFDLKATVNYVEAPATQAVSVQLATEMLHDRSLPEVFGSLVGHLDNLNDSLMGLVDVEHTGGPHATDAGWLGEVWQRRPFCVYGVNIDQNGYKVTNRVKDQKRRRRTLKFYAWSDKASGVLEDGIGYFAVPGALRTFTAATERTFTNPVGDSETSPVDVPCYGPIGLYIRSGERMKWTNNTGSRTFCAAQGSFQCEVNFVAVGAGSQNIFFAYHDASNWASCYWDGANTRWVFEIRAAGTTYRTTKSVTPSSGVTYQIGCRWTGANAELGLTAYTLSIFVDRVIGSNVVAALMTEQATSTLDIGNTVAAGGTDWMNAQVRKINFYQEVLTDIEMQRAI